MNDSYLLTISKLLYHRHKWWYTIHLHASRHCSTVVIKWHYKAFSCRLLPIHPTRAICRLYLWKSISWCGSMNQYHLNDYLLPSPLLRIHKMLHIVDVAVVFSSTDIEDNDSTNLKTYRTVCRCCMQNVTNEINPSSPFRNYLLQHFHRRPNVNQPTLSEPPQINNVILTSYCTEPFRISIEANNGHIHIPKNLDPLTW